MQPTPTTFSITPYLPGVPGDHLRPCRPAPAVLTPEEVVELLRMDAEDASQATDRLRKEGLLAVKFGTRIRFRLPDVLDWLGKKRV